MVSLYTASITAILVLPAVPLLIYVIGLLLPASHIVSRTATFPTSQAHLWAILTNVEQYPVWQSRLKHVFVTDKSNDRVVFEEYTKRHNRRIVVVHVEQTPLSRLLRILEEGPRRVPTFSGSWTFELEECKETKHQDHQLAARRGSMSPRLTTLKVTQQGVIKRPMVRVVHMFLFGFHHRIDIFLRDLARKVQDDLLLVNDQSSGCQRTPLLAKTVSAPTEDARRDIVDELYEHPHWSSH